MNRLVFSLKGWYKRNRRTVLVAYLVYFVAKWSLTIVFGARIVSSFKDLIN
ncbi:MAG: hypothetical protein H6563_06125 [Lewinellaceae bacterium]|nr:hypothetical protein [Lewinellaceae bacterium]